MTFLGPILLASILILPIYLANNSQDIRNVAVANQKDFNLKDNELLIRPVTNEILHGITRQTMLRVAQQMDLKFVERFYKLDEVLQADEALITASSIYVLPVSKIDDHVIADGQAGRFTLALRKAYLETARAEFY